MNLGKTSNYCVLEGVHYCGSVPMQTSFAQDFRWNGWIWSGCHWHRSSGCAGTCHLGNTSGWRWRRQHQDGGGTSSLLSGHHCPVMRRVWFRFAGAKPSGSGCSWLFCVFFLCLHRVLCPRGGVWLNKWGLCMCRGSVRCLCRYLQPRSEFVVESCSGLGHPRLAVMRTQWSQSTCLVWAGARGEVLGTPGIH